jgi:TPR repeat protein
MEDDEEKVHKLLEKGDFKEAFRLLKILEKKNSHYALLTLGWMYETGTLGSADNLAALEYYQRSVSAGSTAAMFELGRLQVRLGDETAARSTFEAGARRDLEEC